MENPIKIPLLLVDHENPRLPGAEGSQLETIQAMLRTHGSKIAALASDIVERGLSPAERLMVMPSEDEDGRFVVLEGNRRLVALKILEAPSLAEEILTSSEMKRLREASTKYQGLSPIREIDCMVFRSRPEAAPWIERRHMGGADGTGIVAWGAMEKQRFDERTTGKKTIEMQVYDYVLSRGTYTEEQDEKLGDISITNLQRLVADAKVRSKLGIDVGSKDQVLTLYRDDVILPALRALVEDLAFNNVRVEQIYNAALRQAYLKKFISRLPKKEGRLDAPRALIGGEGSAGSSAGGKTKGQSTAKPKKKRERLIPTSTKFSIINEPKIDAIVDELRKLKLEDHPNAVSVLMRVFVELSTDAFIRKHHLLNEHEAKGTKLSKKLICAANRLKSDGHLSEKHFLAVRLSVNDQHVLATSLTTLHQYVHNESFSPSPTDLRAAWDNLEPYLVALWEKSA